MVNSVLKQNLVFSLVLLNFLNNKFNFFSNYKTTQVISSWLSFGNVYYFKMLYLWTYNCLKYPVWFFQWLQNYLWDPYLYFYIHIPSNKSRSVQCLPSHTQFCWSVFEEFFNIFSALQSFFFLIMFEIMFFMFIYVSMA